MNRPLSIALLTLLILSLIPPTILLAQPISPQSTKTIDGTSSDWTGTLPATDNTWTYDVTAGEWIWRDATEDTRNDHAQINIDGADWDWNNNYGKYFVVSDKVPTASDYAGANVTELFVAWDNDYLYIAIKTDNAGSWDLAYGFGIDVNGTATGYTGGSDAWGRSISFSGYAIDYEVYFWQSGADNKITSAYAYKWNGASWDDITTGLTWANATQSGKGVTFLEFRLSWSAMGLTEIPSNISVIAWVTGGSGSAVESIPDDPAVHDNEAGGGEWSDTDTFSNLTNIYLTEVNKAVETWADLVEFRVSGDTNNLYLMFKLRNTTGIELGKSGAPWIAVALDYDRVRYAGKAYFPEWSDTRTSSYAQWNYSIVINLADSRLSGRSYVNTTGAIDSTSASILHIYDNDYNTFTGAGTGAIAVDLDQNFIEVAIPWNVIGFASAPDQVYIRFSLMTARGWSNYAGGSGGPWNIYSSSDAIDAMTDAASTWADVSDGYLDYYADIWFENGEPTVPPTTLTIVDPTYRQWYAYEVGETLEVYAKLEKALNPIGDQEVKLLINGTEVASVYTDSNGWANLTWTITSAYAGSLINVTVYHPGNTTSGTEPASDTRFFLVMGKHIDAKADDWSTSTPTHDNTYIFDDTMHEIIWKDAIGDGRGINFTDKTVIDVNNETTDITEVHIASDRVFLYFLVKFNDMSSVKIGENYNPALWIAITKERTSTNTWLCDWTNTDTGTPWDYQIRISLSDPYYNTTKPTYVRDTLRWSYDYHAVLYKLLDHDYNPWTAAGNWFNTTWVAINTTASIIELAIPWKALGGRPAAGENITVYIASALMNSTDTNHADTVPQGYGSSKLLDVVSGLTTADEVGDGVLDYGITVILDSNGYPTHGTTITATLTVNGGSSATVALGEEYTLELVVTDNLGLPVTGADFTLEENNTGIGSYYTDAYGRAVIKLTKTSLSEAGQTFVYNATSITHTNYPTTDSNEVTVKVTGLASRLNLTWSLTNDADNDGVLDVGDTVMFIATVEYFNPSTTSWEPLPNVNVNFTAVMARNLVSGGAIVPTNSSGVAVWAYTIDPITGADNLTVTAEYAGNSSIDGSSSATWFLVNLYRIIDGDRGDWRTDAPADTPGIGNYGEEIVITDPTGDIHDDAADDPYSSDLDAKAARIVVDGEFMYILVEFNDLQHYYSPYIIIALDVTPDNPNDGRDKWVYANGNTDTRLGGFDSTGNHIDWNWTHIIEFNPDRGVYVRTATSYDNYTMVEIAKGVYGVSYAVSTANDIVEIRVPLSALSRIDLSGGFKAWIMVFGNYYGGVKYFTGSNVVDIVGVGYTGGEVLTLRDPASWGNPSWPTDDIWVDTSFLLAFDSSFNANAPLPAGGSPTSVDIIWPTSGVQLNYTSTSKYFAAIVKVEGTQGRIVTVNLGPYGTATGVVGADDIAVIPLRIPNINATATLTATSDGVSDSEPNIHILSTAPLPTPEIPLLPIILVLAVLLILVKKRK